MAELVIAFVRALLGAGPMPKLSSELLSSLAAHNLSPFAYAQSKRARPALLPAEHEPHFRALALQSVERSALQQRRLGEVLATLNRSPAIEVLAWKGLDYANRLYQDPAERPMGDHDLLLRQAQFAEGVARLRSLGFADAKRAVGVATSPAHPAVQLLKNGYSVDVHHCFRQTVRARIDYDEVFACSELGELEGFPVRFLSPMHRLLFHCYHQAGHEFLVPLITFVDLELMLRAQPPSEALFATARRMAVARPLLYALALRAELLGADEACVDEPGVDGHGVDGHGVDCRATPSGFAGARLLPSIARVAEGGPHRSRLLQLAQKAVLIDSVRLRAKFAGFAVAAMLRRK